MKLIGLTGSVATGKSTVARMFQRLGLPIFDADKFAHKVIKKGKPAYARLVKLLGKDILNSKREVDREKVAAVIFRNKILRKKVEGIIHPEVWRAIKSRVAKKNGKLVIIEVPLLFESGWDKKVDLTVVVTCSKKVQKARCNPKFYNRIKAQMPISKKAQLADFIIDNSLSKKLTLVQVKSFLQIIDKAISTC